MLWRGRNDNKGGMAEPAQISGLLQMDEVSFAS